MFTFFVQFLVENRIFSKLSPSQLNTVWNLKYSADQIQTRIMTIDCPLLTSQRFHELCFC